MKISGFSYACNAASLYYPVRESILSILPVCDEFIVVVGRSADGTRELIESIGDPRIRIIDTVWPAREDTNEHIFRQQANIALSHCTGDWCFHIQCDEVVHEKDLFHIRQRCEGLLDKKQVEGMLFSWLHFWGDYDHYQYSHWFCPREIRIVRNHIGVQSYMDSQSFRIGSRKLRVVQLNAQIFHYSMVRPPDVMNRKAIAMAVIYHGKSRVPESSDPNPPDANYGSLEKVPRFTGTHPAVMDAWIRRMNWKEKLQYRGKSAVRFGHDRLIYRILTFLERRLLGGHSIGGSRNYVVLRRVR